MLALALGAKTVKMNHGHHGANHPVKDLETGKVEITSMNHGFTVDSQTLPEGVIETHVSLFDGSNCGIRMTDRPVFSVQYHPEASPGPQDSFYLFERFAAVALSCRTWRTSRVAAGPFFFVLPSCWSPRCCFPRRSRFSHFAVAGLAFTANITLKARPFSPCSCARNCRRPPPAPPGYRPAPAAGRRWSASSSRCSRNPRSPSGW
jgi:hypothetical protein